MSGWLLVLTVAAVGVLHTLVPDHWAPIALLARSQGWSPRQTARAAAGAGIGHVTTTLLLGLVVWVAGVAVAARYGALLDRAAAAALIAFGGWIAWGGWREARESAAHAHEHDHVGHAHAHRHRDGTEHVHWHEHHELHVAAGPGGVAVVHEHAHGASGRTALLLILGSSPMLEGLPAFFAAARYGAAVVGVMALVFALSTIATYVTVSVAATAGMQRVALGPVERYGEFLSGAVVAAVGVVALLAG